MAAKKYSSGVAAAGSCVLDFPIHVVVLVRHFVIGDQRHLTWTAKAICLERQRRTSRSDLSWNFCQFTSEGGNINRLVEH